MTTIKTWQERITGSDLDSVIAARDAEIADLRAALQAQQGDALLLAAAERVRKADAAFHAQKKHPASAEALEWQDATNALVDAALAARREG